MVFDVDKSIEKLEQGKLLTEFEVKYVCEKVRELLLEEANVQNVSSPVTIVGDVHGQFYDVKEIFKIGGKIPDTNYLFLGDYVDRGYYSIETISLITCYKLRYPERVVMLRGNHESRQITQVYGFYTECVKKYGNANVWKHFTDMFDYLTIAALIDNKIFCVHGGLSPNITTLDQIRVLKRFMEVPHQGALTDLLWSDPEPDRKGFSFNKRGAGWVFGENEVDKFLRDNDIEHICRAHQLCMDGYQVLWNDKFSTVWSAPNYCYRCGNLASICEIDDKLNKNFNTFEAAPPTERKTPSKDTDYNSTPDYFI